MLNATEHEISTAKKDNDISCFKTLPHVVFILLVHAKMSTIVGILTFISSKDFMLNNPSSRRF